MRFFLSILLILSFIGCTQELKVSFDSDLWKTDKNGCKNIRTGMYKDIIEYQHEILGLTNKEIIRILGNPERNELHRRNQKFFIYQISPASKCNIKSNSETLYLFVRFNAVGLSQEVFIQGTPSFSDKTTI